jgi:hypothetical protein
MRIGKIIIRKASTIKKRIHLNKYDLVYTARMLQIYECRILGLCIYRSEPSFKKYYYSTYKD